MGLGSTAKKLQEVADSAEKLFKQLKQLRGRMQQLEEDLGETTERVEHLDAEQRRQRAILEAVAAEHGVDVETVLDDLDLPDELAGAEADDAENGASDDESTATDEDAGSPDGDAEGSAADAE